MPCVRRRASEWRTETFKRAVVGLALACGACGTKAEDAPARRGAGTHGLAATPANSSNSSVLATSPRASALLSALRGRYIVGPAGGAANDRPAAVLPEQVAESFERTTDGLSPRFAASHTPPRARVVFPARANGRFHLEDAASGMVVDATLVGAREMPAEVAEGYVVYEKGHESGATLLQRAVPEGMEDFFSFEARPSVPGVAYQVGLSSGVSGLRLVAGTLEFLDRGGAPRLRVSSPYVIGADGERTDAQLTVEGCAVDTGPGAPWNRPVKAPGATACTLRVSWTDQAVAYPALLDPTWSTTGAMAQPRQDHTATLLSNGKVLVTGGRTSDSSTTGLSTAELFDRTTGTWAATASMTGGRFSHTAVQLGTSSNATTSGKVLVAGGITGTASLNTAQLYSVSGNWVAAANLNAARHLHTATLLSNGQVLLAGGMNGATVLNTAAKYNPASGSGSWTATGNMASARRFHSATRLVVPGNATLNNRVLVVGGNSGGATSLTSVQLFDNTNWSTPSGIQLSSSREGQAVVALTNGNVLVTGGKSGATTLNTTLLFNAVTGSGSWGNAGNLLSPRQLHTASLLPGPGGGQALVAGGSTNGTNSLDSAELWDGTSNWTLTSTLAAPTRAHTATMLSGGPLLLVGGINGSTNAGAQLVALSCSSNTECASGFCADGVCCDQACTSNTCQACNLPGRVGTCSPKPSGASCSDGDACTQTDTCQSGVCTGTNPVTCTASDPCHETGTCDPDTGRCSNPPSLDGKACDDRSDCTPVDTCERGTCGGANSCAAPGQYAEIVDLGTLYAGDASGAMGINDNGDVVGSDSGPGGVEVAWRYTDGAGLEPIAFGTPGTAARGNAINSDGLVAGIMSPTRPIREGYGYQAGSFGFVGEPGAEPSLVTILSGDARAINDLGELATIEPWSDGGPGYMGAFRITSAGKQPVDRFRDPRFTGGLIPNGIGPGPNGMIVGEAGTNSSGQLGNSRFTIGWGIREAFLFDETGVHSLNDDERVRNAGWQLVYSARATNGTAITGWGVINDRCHAFRYTKAGGIVDLGAFPGLDIPPDTNQEVCFNSGRVNYTSGQAINSHGEVVGTGFTSYQVGAFYHSDATGLIDLQTLVDPSRKFYLGNAQGINNHGQIVGQMAVGNPNGPRHAFRMTLPDGLSNSSPRAAEKIVPRLERVAIDRQGYSRAVFSYTNSAAVAVHVPFGPDNNLTTEGGRPFSSPWEVPPQWFAAGDNIGAFVATFNSQELTWTVGENSATATRTTTTPTTQITPDGREVIVLSDGSEVVVGLDGRTLATRGLVRSEPSGSATVGSTEAKFEVGADGAARYTLPIWVPPALLKPDLSLTYSSSGDASIAGVGFSLTGLPEISVCGKNIARDGRTAPVQYQPDADNVCFGDQKLVKIAGSSPPEYRAERDDYTRFVEIGRNALGIIGFVAYTKDGRVLAFETRKVGIQVALSAPQNQAPTDPNSADIPSATSREVVYGWALTQMRDRHFNTMYVDWQQRRVGIVGTQYLPTTITYGLDRKVRFYYEAAASPVVRTQSGVRTGFWDRLSRIEVSGPSSGSGGRKYHLAYETGPVSGLDRLTRFTECDDENICKPPIALGWSTDSDLNFETVDTQITDASAFDPSATGIGPQAKAEPLWQHWRVTPLDINGDGKDDIVYQAWRNDNVVLGNAIWRYRLSTGVGFGPPQDLRGFPNSYPVSNLILDLDCHLLAEVDVNYAGRQPIPLDVNADSRADLAMYQPWDFQLCERVEGNAQRCGSNNFVVPSCEIRGRSTLFIGQQQGGFWPMDRDLNGNGALETNEIAVLSGYWGDLNGDGLPDAIGSLALGYSDRATEIPLEHRIWNYRMNLGQGNFSARVMTSVPFAQPEGRPQTSYVVDLDGDGKSEVLIRNAVAGSPDQLVGTMFQALRMNPEGPVDTVPTTLRAANSQGVVDELVQYSYIFADVNGDGLRDPVRVSDDGLSYQVIDNMGSGFAGPMTARQTLPVAQGFGAAAPRWRYQGYVRRDRGARVVDFNQDGKQDILLLGSGRSTENPTTRRLATVLVSDGKKFIPRTIASVTTGINLDQPDEGGQPLPGVVSGSQVLDVNGDGLDDIVQVEPFANGQRKLVLHINRGGKSDLLEAIGNGRGAFTRISYAPLGERLVYQPSESCAYPQFCEKRGSWVVSLHSVPETDGDRSYTHQYTNGRTDLRGRGRLGFGTHVVKDVATGVTTTRTYDNSTVQDGYYPFAGLLRQELVEIPLLSGALRRRVKIYDYRHVAGTGARSGIHSVELETETESINETPAAGGFVIERETTTKYERDDYGNITHREARHRNNAGSFDQIDIEDSTYDNDATKWLIGLQRTSRQESTGANGETAVRKFGYDYDPNTGVRVAEYVEPGGGENLTLTRRWEHNSAGQVTATDEMSASGVLRRTATKYDQYGFPTSTTGPLGETTFFVVNPGLGEIVTSYGPNGERVDRTYDRLGRLHSERRSTGEGFDITRGAAVPTTLLPNASTFERTTRLDGRETTVLHDRLDREISKVVRVSSDQYAIVDTTYDYQGRVATVSVPYEGSSPGLSPRGVNETLYDESDRPTARIFPDGATATYAYDGLSTTITDRNGHARTEVHDGLGRRVKIVETASTAQANLPTSYSYGPFGELRKVTDSRNNVTEFVYDVQGRRTRVIDPDAGLTVFHLDAFGDTTSIEYPDQNVQYVRDTVGRTISEISSDGISQFSWDPVHGRGKLARTLSSTGVEVQYEYDEQGRPERETQHYPSVDLSATTEWSYDDLGRIQTVSYPGPLVDGQPFTVENHYNPTTGETDGFTSNDGSLNWTVDSRNAMRQIVSESMSGLGRIGRDYDDRKGGLLSDTSLSAPDGALLQSRHFDYYPNGILWHRRDVLGGFEDTFTYDGLDRLHSVSYGATSTGEEYDYDELGSLVGRTRIAAGGGRVTATFTVGTSGYGPHQLASRSDASGNYRYDGRGNQKEAPGRSVTYGSNNLPLSVRAGSSQYTFGYDAGGARASKAGAGESIYYASNRYELHVSPGRREHVYYVYSNERLVAQATLLEGSGANSFESTYLHHDSLGSVIGWVDGQGVGTQEFDPWGQPNTVESRVRRGFASLEHDLELGLVSMGARTYEPATGRFLSADPLLASAHGGQGLNPYSYALNTPTSLRDPSGLSPELDAFLSGDSLMSEIPREQNISVEPSPTAQSSRKTGLGPVSTPDLGTSDDTGSRNQTPQCPQSAVATTAEAPLDVVRVYYTDRKDQTDDSLAGNQVPRGFSESPAWLPPETIRVGPAEFRGGHLVPSNAPKVFYIRKPPPVTMGMGAQFALVAGIGFEAGVSLLADSQGGVAVQYQNGNRLGFAFGGGASITGSLGPGTVADSAGTSFYSNINIEHPALSFSGGPGGISFGVSPGAIGAYGPIGVSGTIGKSTTLVLVPPRMGEYSYHHDAMWGR